MVTCINGSGQQPSDSISQYLYPEHIYISIGSEPDYPPFCYLNSKGKPVGMALDVFDAAAKVVNIECTIKPGLWKNLMDQLEDGEIDALPFVGRTPERENIFDFTLSYLSLHGDIFVRKTTHDIKSLQDLQGREVIVMLGDNAEEFVRRERITDKIITVATYEEAFKLLARGEHDAVITQRITGIRLLEELNIKSVKPLDMYLPEFRQDFCFAVTEDNDLLLKRLDEGLSIIIANDTYYKIREHWLSPYENKTYTLKDLLAILPWILVPLFILILILWIYSLHRSVRKATQSMVAEVNSHKQTSLQLQHQKLLLNEMENISLTGGWKFELENNSFEWTEGAKNILGGSPGNFLLKKKPDTEYTIRNKRHRYKLNRSFRNSINNGIIFNMEIEIISRDDRIKWIRIGGHPEIEDGSVKTIFGYVADVTYEHNIIQDLSNSERQIRLLLDSTAEGIFGIDSKGICVFCNQSSLKLLGYEKSSDLTGTFIHDKIHSKKHHHPARKDAAPCGILEILETQKPFHSEDEYFYRSDGSYFRTECFAYPVDNRSGSPQAVVTFWDITDRKKNEAELKSLKEDLEKEVKNQTAQLNKKLIELDRSQKAMLYIIEDLNEITDNLNSEREKLKASNNELEAFSYSVSHDLRAPLRAINGFSKFLIEDYANVLDKEGVRMLSVVRKSAEKMDQLITDLLQLSRLSRIEMNITRLDMKNIAIAMFHEVASKEQEHEFAVEISQMPEAFGDSTLLKQVWSNLISNSLKYSARSPLKKIVITAENDKNGNPVYSIRDFGTGFDPEYTHKMFGLFQRLHTEEEYEGTGVGLAIVERIIKRHGGRIWAEGKPGKGAVFSFTLGSK